MRGTKSNPGFNFIKNKSITRLLEPTDANRLLYRDMDRQDGFVRKLSDGARLTGSASVLYWTNALAGLESTTVNYGVTFNHRPLVLVWLMGGKDKDNYPTQPTSSIVGNGEAYSNPIFGGYCSYYAGKSSLTISVQSFNIGWPSFTDAQFRYVLFYDDFSKEIPELQGI